MSYCFIINIPEIQLLTVFYSGFSKRNITSVQARTLRKKERFYYNSLGYRKQSHRLHVLLLRWSGRVVPALRSWIYQSETLESLAEKQWFLAHQLHFEDHTTCCLIWYWYLWNRHFGASVIAGLDDWTGLLDSKPQFLLRSMPPESLDNTSNSFPPKLRILDRTLSSQNMRGQTAHNRPSSSKPLVEKGGKIYLKTSNPGLCSNSNFKCQTSHDPFAVLWFLSVMFYLDLQMLLLLLRKVVVVIAWLEVRSLVELLIASCILVQIYSVISPSRCMDRTFVGFP